MKNLFKTLLPHKMTALLVLLLMAGQAFCEMNLPQYTQNIIDTGIQNHGIEHVVPEAITDRELKDAETYMNSGQREEWESLFTESGDVLVRVDADKESLEKYDVIFTEPLARRYADKIGEKICLL